MKERQLRSLADLTTSSRAIVVHLEGGTGFKSRLAALGVTVGASLEILQNRGQSPVLALIRDSWIAIGRGEARKILVKGPENAKQGTN